jgi:hypothetical protein
MQFELSGVYKYTCSTVKCRYNEVVRVTKLYLLEQNFVMLKHIKNVRMVVRYM